MAGPQLVVPVHERPLRAERRQRPLGLAVRRAATAPTRSAKKAAPEEGKGYNKVRGDKVIAFARAFLDEAAPLAAGSHVDSTGYAIVDGKLVVALKGGSNTGLRDDRRSSSASRARPAAPTAVLLKHNGLHFEIQIDASSPIGSTDAAGVKDVLMEAALTTIMDCEDSVAAVDADDKVVVYRTGWA